MQKAPKSTRVLIAVGQSFNLMGRYQRAERFYLKALRIAPNDMVTYFCLIESNLNAGQVHDAERYVERLLARFSINKIQDQLNVTSNNIFMAHYSADRLAPVISKKLKQMSNDVSQLGLPIKSAIKNREFN